MLREEPVIPFRRERDVVATILEWCLLKWSVVWLGSQYLILRLLETLTGFLEILGKGLVV